jgi:hypothetical protein
VKPRVYLYIGAVGGRRAFAAVALAALWSAVVVTSAHACSCAPSSPAESLREADGAVVGRLVDMLPRGPQRAVFRYEVRHVYKGAGLPAVGQMLDVHGSRRGSACALPRRTGRGYGLFLSRRGDRWFGGICGVLAPGRLDAAAANRSRFRPRASAAAGCA